MESKTYFNNYTTDNGIELHICKLPKFKTNLIQFYMIYPLKEETASKTALIPYVLYRGTNKYPSSRDLTIKLDNLYGADLNISVVKRGENQVIRFTLEVVNENFLTDKEPIFLESLNLLKELLLNPVLEDGVFKKAYVNQEKEFIKEEIRSLINDKYKYSVERCYQEMCKDEPFSIYHLGNLTSLEKIENIDLYRHYLNLIKNSYMGLFVIGDVNKEEVFKQVNNILNFDHKQSTSPNNTRVIKSVRKVKEIKEKMRVQQGKLTLGYRTGITRENKLYCPLLIYNGILGGFPHSKLFQNVREKESLAYYASSNIESTKGLLLINSGIEFSNYERAKEIIIEQVNDMARGIIKKQEFEWTKKALISQLKSVLDSNNGLAGHYLLGVVNNKKESIDSIINKINKVKLPDVIEVAKRVELDTIYFLDREE